MQKPIFKGVKQVIIVVKDLDASMKKYWEQFGIGPWEIWTFDPSSVSDMTIRGERVDYAMRLAMTNIGEFWWELVQPLDEKSSYAEFLREHGEGIHNVVFDVENFDEALSALKEKGIKPLQGGNWNGLIYQYMDTKSTLGCISEIYKDVDEFPEPEATYP